MSKFSYNSNKHNYFKQYHNIILQAKCQDRIKDNGTYYENHHIMPRCMNGSDDIENLVLLTAREHFICHWLLTKIFTKNDKLYYAFWMMCNQSRNRKNEYRVTSHTYENIRKIFIEKISLPQTSLQRKNESISKIKFYKNNPEERIKHSKRQKEFYKNNPAACKKRSDKLKEYYRKNPNAMKERMKSKCKKYILISPKNLKYEVNNLIEFCNKHSLSESMLRVRRNTGKIKISKTISSKNARNTEGWESIRED